MSRREITRVRPNGADCGSVTLVRSPEGPRGFGSSGGSEPPVGRIGRPILPPDRRLERVEIGHQVGHGLLLLLGLLGHAVDLFEGRDASDHLEHSVGVKR